VLPDLNPAGGSVSKKGFVKPSSSMKGFLRRGFLNPSSARKASTTHTSLLEMVVSSSTPATPFVEKGDDSRVNDDSSLAIMDVFEEDFLWREILNLVIQTRPLVGCAS
jgi:hypothetical protein